MSSTKYTAIVIKSVKYAEHDRMLTLFTLENGKMSAIAKGAGSLKSKYLLSSQLFCCSHFILNEGLKMPYVVSADIIRSFTHLSDDINKLSAASYMAELLNTAFEADSCEKRAFGLLFYMLELLEETPNDFAFTMASAFALKLMGIYGTSPVLTYCVVCNEKSDDYRFDYEYGGCVCRNCADNSTGERLSASEAYYMNDLMYTDIAKLTELKSPDITVQKFLLKLINNYVVYTLSKKIKSFELLYSL